VQTKRFYLKRKCSLDLETRRTFICKTAKDLEEATALVEAGFEYVTEMEEIKLFRIRK